MDNVIESIVASLRDMHIAAGEALDGFGDIVRERAPQLDESPDGVFVKDTHGRMRYQNRTFTELFGKGADRSGCFASEFLPDRMRQISTSTDAFVASFNRPIRIECLIECQSSEILFEVYKFPLHDQDHGRTHGIIGVSRPVGDRIAGEVLSKRLEGFPHGRMADTNRLRQIDELISENNAKLCLLTNQQLKVVCLLASGRTNREAAVELGISRRTVEMHRQAARQRLRVDSFYEILRIVAFSSFDVPPVVHSEQRRIG